MTVTATGGRNTEEEKVDENYSVEVDHENVVNEENADVEVVKGNGDDLDLTDSENLTQVDNQNKDVTEEAVEDENTEQPGPKYVAADSPYRERLWEVLVTFWPLGLVAFGGPQAHVALLRTHLVTQRKWLEEDTFIEVRMTRFHCHKPKMILLAKSEFRFAL